ncbi:UDP-N-acetylmuramoylalanyl-D-glutamate--2,6-diaminopimelate ligase [Dethiosulfatibacter aminovorans DSM 17477]|uniref:UDP-N-acetylmuramoyl-L-alanyl-D-glutamate--2,6-diaminopimelate ligase n=1 Tax=Dethiosulfatibacter aminovorans DSM 17477 TaxID=1121476 RepID=A0A1M6DLB1_9FIRM|nr:UDP-N-acetylmuramoyl-L-alanyl-D-glutamate--2,6-diaminopimelate ligase [Dethiosulfatibacter aminovorans]SHI74046.1 UDP-N-acetylmuramoylalanyl-D-glutamate--2,6-diaminopimelate ligase [Dethiosulfatibacter aminovorans DSM 17477]
MRVKGILNNIEYCDFKGDENVDITDITYDSRKADPNTVFAAIKGFERDGHEYIKDACSNGCRVVLCQDMPEEIDECTFIRVGDTRKAMSDISYLMQRPDEGLNLIGVTGTNGKTSTTYILKKIFDHQGIMSGIIGTMGAVIGEKKVKLNNTTPESPDLHNLMNRMKDEGIENCFMEVSSHSTELYRVKNLKFKSGIFTNLTKDHLVFHKNMENYYQAKKKFFYNCELSIVNMDDEYGMRLYRELREEGINVRGFSMQEDCHYRISNCRINKDESRFLISFNGEDHEVKINTPGMFNVYNYTGALIAALEYGIDIEDIIKAYDLSSGVVGRFEFLPTKLDCTIILDFAHTPDGLEKVMETIDQFATGRKVVMFGAGGGRDIARRALMGKVAGRYCDFVMITADNPRYENIIDICNEIAGGVKEYHNNYMIIEDRGEAIDYLIKNHEKDDVILLAGKSTEPYQVVEDRKVPHFERELAMKSIESAEKQMKETSNDK